MASISRAHSLGATLLVAFVISGCQSSNNKWPIAWKERTKPKAQFQGLDGAEEITYWPNRPGRDKRKMTDLPGQLKEKLTRNSEQTKFATQLAELTKEGDQLRKNGQYEDARMAYHKALLLSPESPDLNHRLAIVADKLKQYPVADQHYQAALRVRPRDVNLLSDLGYSYSLRGSVLQAEQTLKDALAIDKTHKGAMANLGSLYAQQNRFPEAQAMFQAGATEAEAQQYIAQLFPQGRPVGSSLAMADRANSPATPVMASTTTETPLDLSKLSFEQIQAEMARRKQEGKLRRQQADQRENSQVRNFPTDWETIDPAQTPQQQPRMAQTNPRNDVSGGPIIALPFSGGANNALAQERSVRAAPGTVPSLEYFQGLPVQPQSSPRMDSQIQPAWDQRSGPPTNTIQQINGSPHAIQMATQLGMSAGPGSMFPIVSGTTNPSSGSEGAAPAELSGWHDNRVGGEFPHSSNSPKSQNGSGNSTDPPVGATSANAGQNTGFDSLGPASPASNWGSFTTGANGSSNSSSWANETQTASGAGISVDPSSGQSGWGQNFQRKVDAFGANPPETNSSIPVRNANDTSRPFNGAWPNSNTPPSRQSQFAPAIDRSPETLEMMSINPRNGGGAGSLSNSNGATTPSSNGSTPQWPYAPNR